MPFTVNAVFQLKESLAYIDAEISRLEALRVKYSASLEEALQAERDGEEHFDH